ncbi:hypothetical protein RUM43_006818 [Polyplax serrata]|uniref:Uncharacterized protein n=1 Tax=Polyplax serrata TaxID=468196 RepID=A0AAN8SA25_POLSC
MTTKVFHDIPEVCAEEICGSEETISAVGDDFLEPEYNHPITRSHTNLQEKAEEELHRLTSTRSRADSGALLDMLAEVASQKLLFSPMKRKSGYDLQKTDKDCSLTVSQVKSLSTNQLIKLFSTTEFNEIKKLYSFHCSFDQNCNAKFISFGNENRAKEKFKKHLFLHLETLKTDIENEENDEDDSDGGEIDEDNDDVDQDGGEDDTESLKRPKISWDEQTLLTDLNVVPATDSKQTGFLFEERSPKIITVQHYSEYDRKSPITLTTCLLKH